MIKQIFDWILRYLAREFVLPMWLIWLTYQLALGGKLTPEWAAVILPVTAYVWKRTPQKNGE